MNIHEIKEKIKSWEGEGDKGGVLLAIVFVLFGAVSFGLGKWSETSKSRRGGEPVIIAEQLQKYKVDPLAFYDGKRDNNSIAGLGINNSATVLNSVISTGSAPAGGMYVASKNGKKYYTKDCATANRIKPENMVWYKTEQEAKNAGYELSVTCK